MGSYCTGFFLQFSSILRHAVHEINMKSSPAIVGLSADLSMDWSAIHEHLQESMVSSMVSTFQSMLFSCGMPHDRSSYVYFWEEFNDFTNISCHRCKQLYLWLQQSKGFQLQSLIVSVSYPWDMGSFDRRRLLVDKLQLSTRHWCVAHRFIVSPKNIKKVKNPAKIMICFLFYYWCVCMY